MAYPTDEELEKIANWEYTDFKGLMKFVESKWEYPDYIKHTTKDNTTHYQLSTGGWSGNECIIIALQSNTLFWAMCWQLSKRGGHYEFELRELSN